MKRMGEKRVPWQGKERKEDKEEGRRKEGQMGKTKLGIEQRRRVAAARADGRSGEEEKGVIEGGS